MGDVKNWKQFDIFSPNETVGNCFKVIRKISQGGFGQVFEIEYSKRGNLKFPCDLKVGTRLAMKVESKQLSRSVLKFEAEVLRKFNTCDAFYNCYDLGEGDGYFYMVQTLGGMDLSRLVKSQPNKVLTFETTLRLALLMIEPLEEFHRRGYVHRDVKLANFIFEPRCFQSPPKVVLIDFGVVKRVTRADGQLKSPQEAGKGKYQGTYYYSSIRALQLEEPWKNDDLISVYYSLLSMLNRQLIPWRNLKDKQAILEKKKQTSISTLHKTFPVEVRNALARYYEHLMPLQYGEDPDYDCLRKFFGSTLDLWNVDRHNDAFEWESEGKRDLAEQEDALKSLFCRKMSIGSKSRLQDGKIASEEKNAEEDWLNKRFLNRFMCGKGIGT